eukprot:2087688-Rhodomonas_salina.1
MLRVVLPGMKRRKDLWSDKEWGTVGALCNERVRALMEANAVCGLVCLCVRARAFMRSWRARRNTCR